MQRMMSSANVGSSSSLPTPKRATTPVPPSLVARASQPPQNATVEQVGVAGSLGCH